MADSESQILLKILSVGDTQVGKSCLIKRYCEERFVNKYITTIGVDYGVKKMAVMGKKTAVNFFDLSGDDDYEEIRNPFFKDAQGVILVFDLENRESFTNLIKWERVMKENGLDFARSVIFVVGNKSDVRSKDVEQSEITAFVRKRGWEYFQTSANTGDNVKELFEKLFQKCVDMLETQKQKLK
ncbi:small guanosine triphosphatase family Ras-related in brain (Rab) family protein (macronuclear) [Tetrahymena thermophila SB210]|uniref:Small guanosine triphosphatase family Ras-related in brain (Rab) family protein n=1 Tax=Tetrahymena thermophila (strain SB210) TaxID=312017 RepID=Q23F98_TETTS|nr:small guanosine triphosphatase family Ras-related in brain (Rab) family protein [Tetrahymena thermophila SB210]EAR95255.2 small guanosine triphosphatase family Ras-related in brain (Rab) family protein [Tetrahymena thermophila SB210]|eukprot:XP_001015500.2 small guanosine triphosphatase family Ras-related in brain (Rab) family protein [Tetrahymena thermophila SB210]